MFLSLRQVFGAAEHLARKPTNALATGEVVAFNKTGIARLTHDGRGQARWHSCCRAEDDLGGHLHHTPAFPAFDDLGIGPVSRGRRLGVGLGPRLPRMCRMISGVPYPCNKAWVSCGYGSLVKNGIYPQLTAGRRSRSRLALSGSRLPMTKAATRRQTGAQAIHTQASP